MSNQILSIYGLYQYDKTLFDGMKLPEGLEKTTLINNLLLELGVLETLYPDSDFMKIAIKVWSEKEFHTWEELYATMLYEYDPIANYDRTENWTVTRNANNTDTGESGSNDSGESSGGGSGSESGSGTNVGKIAAFNSPTLENKESSDSTNESGYENDYNNTYSSERSGTYNRAMRINETLSKDSSVKGNIGVTTTQQMIEAQRKVVEFNMYNYIIDSFKYRFCIMVY